MGKQYKHIYIAHLAFAITKVTNYKKGIHFALLLLTITIGLENDLLLCFNVAYLFICENISF